MKNSDFFFEFDETLIQNMIPYNSTFDHSFDQHRYSQNVLEHVNKELIQATYQRGRL